ncbi:GNAT family N-acetyltransferase [Flavobacterium sp. SM2513]|uniref:GNAT family N-acetyltransferase n=1 Tax=Flavobacterium sp. SM2513 TaxID=3424766 RepID=UPI003D7F7683
MKINLQPTLENENTLLLPLHSADFEALYSTASDPTMWEQHPNKNRWQKQEFQNFFQGALESKGAFKIVDKATNSVIGSTRFYDYDPQENQILIGYTFYNTHSWGKGINAAVKKVMLNYIFQYVSKVIFYVGSTNLRSQIAMNRQGIEKIGAQEVAYFGEPSKLNYVYQVNKKEWFRINNR